MTYNEFISEIKNKVFVSPYCEWLYHYPSGNKFDSKNVPKFDYILNSVEIGGSRGGSCWGGESQRYSCENNEKTFSCLDTILELVAPTVTFLQYRSLSRLIETFDTVDYEYYGNYTEYRREYIKLQELYDWLVEKNYIDPK